MSLHEPDFNNMEQCDLCDDHFLPKNLNYGKIKVCDECAEKEKKAQEQYDEMMSNLQKVRG